MKALLIVDMQNDFMPGGSLPVPYANELIPRINTLQEKFDLVFATQDWHPENHCSFNHFPRHCVQNTEGAKLATGLNTDKIKFIFQKGTNYNVDSFGAFKNNIGGMNYYSNGTMNNILNSYHVSDLYIVGVALEYCILANALNSKEFRFHTFVIPDACKGIDERKIKAVYTDMANNDINIQI